MLAYGENAINELTNGFKYYDEMAYLQVFIPFVEERGGIIDEDEEPIIVLCIEDEPILPGFSRDENGAYRFINVDEEMARTQLVWVISTAVGSFIRSLTG